MTREMKKTLPEKTKTQRSNPRQRSKNDAEEILLTQILFMKKIFSLSNPFLTICILILLIPIYLIVLAF